MALPRELRTILLTGFMGAGKSTVGALLAQNLPFLFQSPKDPLDPKLLQLKPAATLQLRATYDYGVQRRSDADGGMANWFGWAAIARWQFRPTVALALRGEQYSDAEQVIVATARPYGLRVSGGSLNVDVSPVARLLWRTELRALRARDPLFTHGSGTVTDASNHDTFVVSSLALTF